LAFLVQIFTSRGVSSIIVNILSALRIDIVIILLLLYHYHHAKVLLVGVIHEEFSLKRAFKIGKIRQIEQKSHRNVKIT